MQCTIGSMDIPTLCQLYYRVSCVCVHNQTVHEFVTCTICQWQRCISCICYICVWEYFQLNAVNLHSNMKQLTVHTICIMHMQYTVAVCCMSQTGQHEPLLEVTKQQMCMKYCSGGLYYQLQGSCWNVGHCMNLWLLPTRVYKPSFWWLISSWLPTRPLSYFQQICGMSQTGQYEPSKGSCCPVWDMQHISQSR